MKSDLENKVSFIMQKIEFPDNAQTVFLDALSKFIQNDNAFRALESAMTQYAISEDCDYDKMTENVTMAGEEIGIHKYTSKMLMFLCLADTLKKRYDERQISEDIYYNTLRDLTYKLEECRLVEGVVGSFVAGWFIGFFKLKRFGLGRLQFEIRLTKKEHTFANTTLPIGTKTINTHIPRTGTRLGHDQVLDAYAMAAEFFADDFDGAPVIFTCRSWMLDPWNTDVLAPGSNMYAFFNDYVVSEKEEGNIDGEMWRLFDCKYTGDPSTLPRDSSLRRAYADRLARGEKIYLGRGFFYWRDGKVCHN